MQILGQGYRVRVYLADGNIDSIGYSLGLYWYINKFNALVVRCVNAGNNADQILKTYASGTFNDVVEA